MTQQTPAPVLVFGWGNRSRGDDALGPLCMDGLRATHVPLSRVELLDDYQLQIEHALDLVGRTRVLFVDASAGCRTPFEVTSLQAQRDASLTTHALSPQALLQVFIDLRGEPVPPATLLAIRGEAFELGAPLSATACANLQPALAWCRRWLDL
jgi:hydrogenase maturation protease